LDLVGDDQGGAGRAERFEVPAQNAVTGHDELDGVQLLERALAAVAAADRDRGAKRRTSRSQLATSVVRQTTRAGRRPAATRWRCRAMT